MSKKLASALAAIVALLVVAGLDAYVGVPNADKVIASLLILGGGHQVVQAYIDNKRA